MQTSNTDPEVLIEELELHKAEFSAVRTEILHWLDAERQYLNMCLIAIAAGLGIVPFIIEYRVFVSLLLFPIVFHVLLWEMLSSLSWVGRLSSYLVEDVIPRVNSVLDELGDDRRGTTVLGWEARLRTRSLEGPDRILSSLSPTRHWVPVIAIATLLVSYIITTRNYGYALSLNELLLIVVNLLSLILAAGVITTRTRSARRGTHRLHQQAKQVLPIAEEKHTPEVESGTITEGEK